MLQLCCGNITVQTQLEIVVLHLNIDKTQNAKPRTRDPRREPPPEVNGIAHVKLNLA